MKTRLFVLITSSLLTLCVPDLHAAVITWIGGTGNWETPANWEPNTVPGPSDTAIITNAGADVSLSGPVTIGEIMLGTNGGGTVALNLSGQTLSLNGPLTVSTNGNLTIANGALAGNSTNAVLSGPIVWTGGDLAGVLVIATNGTLTLAGGANNMPNMTLVNNGLVAWASGTIAGGGGGGTTISNYGVWDAQSDQSFTTAGYGGQGITFDNLGTFRKSLGTNTSGTVFGGGVTYNQLAGVLDVQEGNLYLQAGGNFTGGYTTTNSTGTTLLNGGAFTINGTLTSSNVWEDGGNLGGDNIINGALSWSTGQWNGAGFVTIDPNSTLYITSGGNNSMANTVVTNNGTVEWVSGTIAGGGGNGTTIYNNGVWDAQSDQAFTVNGYGGQGITFDNFGIFRKSAGTNTSQTLFESGVTFNQLAGAVDAQNGNLTFQGGGSFTGGYTTTNSTATTHLNGGTFTINGTVTSSNVWEDGGNLGGDNIINGALTWTAGQWNSAGFVTIDPSSTLYIASGGNNSMANTVVTNNGTVEWVSGTIAGGGGNGTTIYNHGVWDAQSDQAFTTAGFGGQGITFDNFGTFRKSAGTNDTILQNGVVFNQLAGVLDVQEGNLYLQGGGSFTGGYTTTNSTGTTHLNGQTFTINGTLTSSNVWEDGGNLGGDNIINGALSWSTGQWNGAGFVTIDPNSTLYIASGGNNSMANTVVTNNGTVEWVSGTIAGGGGNGTTIYNHGVWDAQSDQAFTVNGYGGQGMTINNTGTFRKTGGVIGNETLLQSGVVFNQLAGILDVQAGNLILDGGGSFSGGYVTTNTVATVQLNYNNFQINGTITTTNVIENGGNLAQNNVINGALTWTGGIWNNAASVSIASTATLIIAGGGGNNDMADTVVTNNGTVEWVSGTIAGGGGNGTTIYNNGVWDAQSDQVFTVNGYGGQGMTINNTGTFRKMSGVSTNETALQNGVVFNQLAGILDVQAGNLILDGGGSFSGGYVTTNNVGTIQLNYNNFQINGTITTTNVIENGGNLFKNNVISGGLTWTAGVWNSAASVTIASNATLIVEGGGGNNDFANTVVTNNGTVAWVSGTIAGGGGSGTMVYNNGVWDVLSDETMTTAGFGGQGITYNNTGTFRKAAGVSTNQTYFSGVFFNQLSGVLDVQEGNLTLAAGGSFTGGYVTTNSTGFTYLNGGNFLINGTLTTTNVVQDGGYLVETNVISGGLTWTAGVWNGAASVTIASNATLIVDGSGNNNMANTVVTNDGILIWAGGTIAGGGGNGTTIYNNGVWNALSDQTMTTAGYGGQGLTFENGGTFEKTGGTNTTSLQISFLNKAGGNLEADSGTVSLGGSVYAQNGGAFTVMLGGNSPGQWGSLVTSGSATLGGPLNLKFAGGFVPTVGGRFQILSASSVNGLFTTGTLPFGMGLVYTKTGVTVVWNGVNQGNWSAGLAALHGTSGDTFLLAPGMSVQLTATGKAGTFQLGTTTGTGLTTLSFSTASLPDGLYTLLATVYSSGQVIGQYSRSIFVNNSLNWHEGTLTSSQTWTAGTVNAIDQNIIIPSGVTLTIAPGAILKFAQGAGIIIEAGGTLDASGATASNPIIFTSLTDSSVGGASDENPNSVPKLGDWNGISVSGQFLTSAFVQVRYVIQTHSGTLTENQEWFGYAEHLIVGSVTVPTNVTLTIDPGAVVKFEPGLYITVQAGGTLVATGTVAQPIVFTSINDESVGVDTNEVATTPAAGDWDSIYLTGGQAIFDHALLSYGGGPDSLNSGLISITAAGSVLTVSDSILKQGEYKGIQAEYGTVNVTNCVITGCDRGIQPGLSGPTTVNIVNCTLDNNNYGILAHGGVVNVYNSIISDSLTANIEYCCGSALTIFEYNDVWSANGGSFQNGVDGNISANPNYVNVANGNYELNYGSPCIDAADGLIAPLTDLTGAPRYNDPRTTVKKGIANASGLYPDMGAYEFVETASSPVDLTVSSESISGPSQITSGQTVAVQWSDVNIGTGGATGPWHDTISLVPTNGGPVLTVATVLVAQNTVLGPGQTYAASANVVVPGGSQGAYLWQVDVNSEGDVFEGINWTNNTVLGPAQTTLADATVAVGSSVTNVFTAEGQSNVFALTTGSGTFAVTVQANAPGTALELFVGNGYVPSPSHFDFESGQFNSATASVTVRSTNDPTYYIVVYAVALGAPSVSYTVSATSLNFALNSVSPTSVANAGSVTLEVQGDDLAASNTYSLSGPGGVFAATSVQSTDPTVVYATFNLNGAAAGLYSLKAAQTGGATVTLTNAVTVVSQTKVAAAAAFSVQLELPSVDRKGRPFQGSVVYRDAGDVNMPSPVLILSSGGQAETEVQGMTNYTTGDILLVAASLDGPAGTLTPDQTWTIDFTSYYPNCSGSPFTVSYVTVETTNLINYTTLETALRPPGYCASAWTEIWTNFQAKAGPTWGGFVSLMDSYATSLAEANPSRQFYQVQDVLTYAFANLDTVSCVSSGSLAPPGTPAILGGVTGASETIPCAASADPNDKFATGVGGQDWVAPGDAITYTIDFANETNASAPAQSVTITDALATNLDWSTLQLTSIAFNNVALSIPPGVQTFTALAQVETDTNPVSVNAALNPSSGVVSWTIQSINKITGELVVDPLAGFLPPDNAQGQGEGYVTFTIEPKSGAATGAIINNQASIVFDVNAAILTPTTTNLVDATAPTSAIVPLAASSSPTFTVYWFGQDTGSGVAGFNIYVSTNSGPWASWLANTTNTSATFTGASGNVYAFYSEAYDEVGNVESNPVIPGASTTVGTVLTFNIAHAAAGAVTITWPQGALLQATNLLGPWETITATSPLTIPATNSASFYKLQLP